MSVFLTSLTLSFYNGAAWTDISSYQVGSYSGRDGISDTKITNRVASPGTLSFRLNNTTGAFTVGGASVLTGWQKGVKVKLDAVFDGWTLNIFRGYVDTITLPAQPLADPMADIECIDWFGQLPRHPLKKSLAPRGQTTFDEGISDIMDAFAIRPANTNIRPGRVIFPTGADTIIEGTNAAGEIQKMTMSELGFTYLRRDETLVTEGYDHRKNFTVTTLPLVSTESGNLLLETGDALLLETGDNLLLNQVQNAEFDNTMTSLEVSVGPNHFNNATVKTFPRDTGTPATILYSLDTPIQLPKNQAVTFRGSWKDPTTGESVSAIDAVTPVVTTDYLANALEDGTGTNRSANLVVNTWNAYSDGFEVTMTLPNRGWLTAWNPRATPVYRRDPKDSHIVDQDNIDDMGDYQVNVDMPYGDDHLIPVALVDAEMITQNPPKSEGTRVSISANTNNKNMQAFLRIQTGDVVNLIGDRNEIDAPHYVYNREYDIAPGGLINYSWLVKEAFDLDTELTEVEVQFTSVTPPGTDDVLNISHPVFSEFTLFGQMRMASVRGFQIIFADNLTLTYYPTGGDERDWYLDYNTSEFRWRLSFTPSVDTWYPFSVSLQLSGIGQQAVFAFNSTVIDLNVLATITSGEATGLGAIEIGAVTQSSLDAKIRRLRLFNRILTSAEHLALHASPSDYSLYNDHNLLLAGFFVPTIEYADMVDVALTEGDHLLERKVGFRYHITSGNPTVRAIT